MVGGITRTVFNITLTLTNFIKDTRQVDQSVKSLLVEFTTLGTALKAVQAGLAEPAIQNAERRAEKVESLDLWQSVAGSLISTRATVDKLDEALEDIRGEKSNFAKQAIKQMKLNLKSSEIVALRSQCQTHTTALQMALLMINV